MSKFFDIVLNLVNKGEVRISEHGYNELAEDAISINDIFNGIQEAVVLEEYPNYPKGPCVLLLQKDKDSKPIHVVWGIAKGYEMPVILVTAYRPDPERWDDTFTRRR